MGFGHLHGRREESRRGTQECVRHKLLHKQPKCELLLRRPLVCRLIACNSQPPACAIYTHPVGPGVHPESTLMLSILMVSPVRSPVTFTLCPAWLDGFRLVIELVDLPSAVRRTAESHPSCISARRPRCPSSRFGGAGFVINIPVKSAAFPLIAKADHSATARSHKSLFISKFRNSGALDIGDGIPSAVWSSINSTGPSGS